MAWAIAKIWDVPGCRDAQIQWFCISRTMTVSLMRFIVRQNSRWIQGANTTSVASSHLQPAAAPPLHPIVTTHVSVPPSAQALATGSLVQFPSLIQVSPPGSMSTASLTPVIDPRLMPLGGFSYSPSPSPGPMSPIPSSVLLPSSAPPFHSGTPGADSLPLPILKHRRVSSQRLPSGTPPPASPIISQQWSDAHQEWFECHIANITASCGLPFNWVENQAVRNFLDDFLPFATPISSYQITNRIVPHEVNQYWQLAKSTSKGCQATLQTDGWTGINFHHLVAFMVTTVKCKVCYCSLLHINLMFLM